MVERSMSRMKEIEVDLPILTLLSRRVSYLRYLSFFET